MSLTYVQLKQAIQDFTENDATEFTTATGSGKAPIDLCIEFAEMRIFREADVAAYRKTVDVTLSANNQFLDLPQDLYVTRYIKTKTGEATTHVLNDINNLIKFIDKIKKKFN